MKREDFVKEYAASVDRMMATGASRLDLPSTFIRAWRWLQDCTPAGSDTKDIVIVRGRPIGGGPQVVVAKLGDVANAVDSDDADALLAHGAEPGPLRTVLVPAA